MLTMLTPHLRIILRWPATPTRLEQSEAIALDQSRTLGLGVPFLSPSVAAIKRDAKEAGRRGDKRRGGGQRSRVCARNAPDVYMAPPRMWSRHKAQITAWHNGSTNNRARAFVP